MTDQITRHASGTSITGPNSMSLYRAIVLKAALNLYAKSGILATRNATPTAMLTMATEYTGVKYKRGQHAIAAEDMAAYIEKVKETANIVREE